MNEFYSILLHWRLAFRRGTFRTNRVYGSALLFTRSVLIHSIIWFSIIFKFSPFIFEAYLCATHAFIVVYICWSLPGTMCTESVRVGVSTTSKHSLLAANMISWRLFIPFHWFYFYVSSNASLCVYVCVCTFWEINDQNKKNWRLIYEYLTVIPWT